MSSTKSLMSKQKLFKIGLETIEDQNTDFGNKIEAIIANIKDAGNNKPELVTELEELIFKRLGLSVTVKTKNAGFGAIEIFPINEHNILLDDMFKGHDYFTNMKKTVKIKTGDKGYIDLKNAKVSGIFSKFKHTMYIDIYANLTKYMLTPGEVTGIILHELGHAFTWYEYSDRLESTNQVLQNIVTELLSNKKDKNVEYIYRELKGTFNASDKDIDDIVHNENKTIVGTKLFMLVVNNVKSQMPIAKYNEVSSEQLADQFATRFGYGRELIEALYKVHTLYSAELNDFNRTFSYLYELSAIYAMAAFMYAAIYTIFTVGVAASLFPAFLAAIMFFLFKYVYGENTKDMTYDDVLNRYKRVRQDIINRLKDVELEKEDLKNFITSITGIDNLIKEVKPYVGLIGPFMNFIFSSNRNAKSDIEIQQMLEGLTNNDLFLKSAQLKLLSN